MKRISFSLLLVYSALLSFAQSAGNVKFMGISMDAPFSEFVSTLSTKLTLVGATEHMAAFKGDFAGLNDCQILVATTDGALGVIVQSKEYNTWGQLKNDYLSITEAYEKKYGKPTASSSTFEGRYCDGCGNEMNGIKNEMSNYSSAYLIDERLLVAILITKDCQIVFTYMIVEEEKEPTKLEVNSDDI